MPPRALKRVSGAATLAQIPGKGVGVVAIRDVPAWTFIGEYPGRVLTDAQYADRIRRHLTTTTYAVEYMAPGHVVDPGGADGGLDPAYAAALAPRINEPNARRRPNVVWVWNLPAARMEMWTFRAVRAGQELTACYGTGGGYVRQYCTSCVGGNAAEPMVHVIQRPGDLPRPITTIPTTTAAAGPRTACTSSTPSGTRGIGASRTGRSTSTRRTARRRPTPARQSPR